MTMTNNPTIDGVSREEFERSVVTLYGNADLRKRNDGCYINDQIQSAWWGWKERSALLDAPAVERQQPFAWFTDDYLTDKSSTTYDELTSARWKDKGWSVQPLYTAPPEVAALQSTIAQLQARVAELESGMGEPVAWETVGVNEYGLQCRKAVTEIKPEIESVWLLWGDRFTVSQRPLFTAPPAPVAVDERAAFEKWVTQYVKDINYNWPELVLKRDGDCYATTWVDSANIGWQARACLDATAALNGERK